MIARRIHVCSMTEEIAYIIAAPRERCVWHCLAAKSRCRRRATGSITVNEKAGHIFRRAETSAYRSRCVAAD